MGTRQWRRVVGVAVAAALTATGVQVVAAQPAAAASCGQVLVAGSAWLGGRGVDARSNGSWQGTGTACAGWSTANPAVRNGFGWQCVELASRLYAVKGWGGVRADGGSGAGTYRYGAKYTKEGSPGLTFHANGSGYVPVPGDLVVEWNSTWGHVAVVDSVSGGAVAAVDQNAAHTSRRTYSRSGSTLTSPTRGNSVRGFLHSPRNGAVNPPDLQRYANRIVQWDGDTKTQKTAWLVTPDLRRLWIPDGGTYWCLRNRGLGGPDVLPAGVLDRLADQRGQWAACGDTLGVSRVLRRNMYLSSADGRYRLWLQGDGNIVLYGPSGRALWANNRLTTDMLIMQGDGNLVGYSNAGGSTWASNTTGSGGNRLVVQNDGNLVIYSATRAVWATNTAGRT